MTSNRKKILFVTGVLLLFMILLYLSIKPMLSIIQEPDKLRLYIESKGPVGILLFVSMIIIEVLTGFIPAGPFQVVAGYIFGSFKGAFIYNLAAAFSSCIAFLLSRTFGKKILYFLFEEDKIHSLLSRIQKHNIDLFVFMIYFVPGLPKDIIAYLSGITDMKLSHFALIIFFARIPSVLMSVYSGDSLANGNYIVLLICTFVIILISYFAKKHFDKSHKI